MITVISKRITLAVLAGLFVFVISKLAFYGVCRIGGHNMMEFMYGASSPAILAVGAMLMTAWLAVGVH